MEKRLRLYWNSSSDWNKEGVLVHENDPILQCTFRTWVGSSFLYWICYDNYKISQDVLLPIIMKNWGRLKRLGVYWEEKKKGKEHHQGSCVSSFLSLVPLPQPFFPFPYFVPLFLAEEKPEEQHPKWSSFWLYGSKGRCRYNKVGVERKEKNSS